MSETDRLALARTATLLGSVLTALGSGTNYVYSAYAPQLGSRLHISHTRLNVIGIAGNVGVYATGPVSGQLVDKRGPRPLLIMSIFLHFIGYMGIRAYYNAGERSEVNFPLASLTIMSIFSFMTGIGGNFGIMAATNATAKNFPDRMRATAVGFVVSGFGLSAFFFSSLANWVFPGNTSDLLLFLALGTSLAVTAGFLMIRPVSHAKPSDQRPGGLKSPTDRGTVDSTTPLLGQTTYESHLDADRDPGHASAMDAPHSESRLVDSTSLAREDVIDERASSEESAKKYLVPDYTVNTHGRRMLLGWEFWLLFTIFSLETGTGLMYINNVGAISQALSAKGNQDYDRIKAGKVQAAQVSIVSLANFAARIIIGVSADFAKGRFAIHRSYLLSLISIVFILSQIVGSQVENVEHLWVASVLLGLGYGGIFGLLPTITIEWFGLPHFSENWGFVSLAPVPGGNIFGIIFGRYLDAHAPVTADTNKESQCLQGRECYAGAMLLTTYACVLALLLSVLAGWRDKRAGAARRREELTPGTVSDPANS